MLVFLDLDGTLMDHEGAERRACLAYHAASPGLFPWEPLDFARRWHDSVERHFERYARGEVTHQGQRYGRMQELWAAMGRTISDAEVDAEIARYLVHYEAAWEAYPDAAACLEALTGAGIPLGVITNGRADQQRQKLERLGFLGHFRHLVISEAVGAAKPDRRIFAAAARAAALPPERLVYVGDRLDVDAEASRAAGWRGIWLDRSGQDRPCGGVEAIRSLAQLPDLLRRTP